MNSEFWKDKRVLITGHSGFKGSWLSMILNFMGAEILGISKESLNNNSELYGALDIKGFVESHDADIRDSGNINKVFSDFKPEIVFHLAAQPLVRKSYSFPSDTYEINVMGTINILEAIRANDSVRSSLMVTTDKCYDNKEWIWGYRENDAMGGHDPYSSSKGCAELVVQSYQKSYFNNSSMSALSSVRAGNVIGGGDLSQDRLIPDIVRAIKDNSKVSIRNPLATRPWQHVFEPLNGYLMAAEDLFQNGHVNNTSWNFGPLITDIRSVDEITQLFCQIWGDLDIIEYDKTSQVHEANLLSLDVSKAYHELKWRPKWSLNESMSHIVNWYKEYISGGDLLDLSKEQIQLFFIKNN
jgi:CDP-glucose 4,6-dehydratase